jgi:hypothetical protein
MLSMEMSLLQLGVEEVSEPGQKRKKKKNVKTAPAGEINWSLGTYVKRQEVEKTFGISGLPRTSKIAPNQLYPHKKVYKYWGLMLAATFLLGLVVMATGSHTKIFEKTFSLEPVANSEGTQVVFDGPFQLNGRKNIRVSAQSSVDNSWLYVEGDLIDEATGEVQSFSLPVEYYHGVDDGESWSEGSQSPSVHLSAMPAGQYTLRLEAQWEKWQLPAAFTVRIEQGVPRLMHLFLTMLLVSVIPVLVAINQFSFEKRRWADSDYSPFGS